MSDEIITVRITRYFRDIEASTRIVHLKRGGAIEQQDAGKDWKTIIVIEGMKGEQGDGGL